MDKLTKEQRRKTMQAIKSKGSKIERKLEKALQEKGYNFTTNYLGVKGKPDIVFLPLKIAIFCDSNFWHGYNWAERKYNIKSNRDFWWKKIERNIDRDKEVSETLKKDGWEVIRFWGHDIKDNLADCLAKIEDVVNERDLRND